MRARREWWMCGAVVVGSVAVMAGCSAGLGAVSSDREPTTVESIRLVLRAEPIDGVYPAGYPSSTYECDTTPTGLEGPGQCWFEKGVSGQREQDAQVATLSRMWCAEPVGGTPGWVFLRKRPGFENGPEPSQLTQRADARFAPCEPTGP